MFLFFGDLKKIESSNELESIREDPFLETSYLSRSQITEQYPNPNMTGYVRRAQRKLAKAEAQLVAARAELARQQALDVDRLRLRAERAAAKKEAKRTLHAKNPQLAYNELYPLMISVCLEMTIRYQPSLIWDFLEWKKVIEFPPKTNRYEKVIRFINEAVKARAEHPIPIVAKLMTGELIPLEYQPHLDKRHLQEQLAKISPEEFPIGSVNITRLCDDPRVPVKEGDVFGLFQNGAKYVSYLHRAHEKIISWVFDKKYGPCITYHFQVSPSGAVRLNGDPLTHSNQFHLYYYPRDQLVSKDNYTTPCPFDQLIDHLRTKHIGHTWEAAAYRYMLTDDALAELYAIFNAIRMEP